MLGTTGFLRRRGLSIYVHLRVCGWFSERKFIHICRVDEAVSQCRRLAAKFMPIIMVTFLWYPSQLKPPPTTFCGSYRSWADYIHSITRPCLSQQLQISLPPRIRNDRVCGFSPHHWPSWNWGEVRKGATVLLGGMLRFAEFYRSWLLLSRYTTWVCGFNDDKDDDVFFFFRRTTHERLQDVDDAIFWSVF